MCYITCLLHTQVGEGADCRVRLGESCSVQDRAQKAAGKGSCRGQEWEWRGWGGVGCSLTERLTHREKGLNTRTGHARSAHMSSIWPYRNLRRSDHVCTG